MTVAQLIRQLKKYPQSYRVAFACHDNSDDEIQGFANCIDIIESGPVFADYGKVVVLRP